MLEPDILKVLVVPETLGTTTWEDKLVDSAMYKYDKVVFMGSRTSRGSEISPQKAYSNLVTTVQFKRKFPTKVILLFAYEDYWYLFPDAVNKIPSQLQWQEKKDSLFVSYSTFLKDHKSYFNYCYQIGKTMFINGYITQNWMESNLLQFARCGFGLTNEFENLSQFMNMMWRTDLREILLMDGYLFNKDELFDDSHPEVMIGPHLVGESEFLEDPIAGLNIITSGIWVDTITEQKTIHNTTLINVNSSSKRASKGLLPEMYEIGVKTK